MLSRKTSPSQLQFYERLERKKTNALHIFEGEENNKILRIRISSPVHDNDPIKISHTQNLNHTYYKNHPAYPPPVQLH